MTVLRFSLISFIFYGMFEISIITLVLDRVRVIFIPTVRLCVSINGLARVNILTVLILNVSIITPTAVAAVDGIYIFIVVFSVVDFLFVII